MLFEVRRQRHRGRPVSKQDLAYQVPVRGDLRVQERAAEEMGRRVCRVASLHALDRAIEDELLPPLYDASLLWAAPLGMVLGGVEFEGGVGYLQSWLLTPWERSGSFASQPCHVASREGVRPGHGGARSAPQGDADSQQRSPVAEPIEFQASDVAEAASANNSVAEASNPP